MAAVALIVLAKKLVKSRLWPTLNLPNRPSALNLIRPPSNAHD